MPPGNDETLRCAFCFKDLNFLTLSQREAHYEHHFLNDMAQDFSPKSSKTPKSPIPSGSSKTTYVPSSNIENSVSKIHSWKSKETDCFWRPEQTIPPPRSFTPGLLQLIKKGLIKGHRYQLIRRAVLCYEKVVHINREPWDAYWGCGYRNFLMACVALMSQVQQPMYFPLLDAPLSPSIRNLQTWIENAWKEGFDSEGQSQLKNLVGTTKWIGTADLWVAFSHRGIPAELVEFDLTNNSRGSEAVIDWVVNYFSPSKSSPIPRNAFESIQMPPIVTTEKMPLILQHDGHSRMIIGYEVDRFGAKSLLTFDPAFRPPTQLRAAALKEFAQHYQSTESSSWITNLSSTLKRKRADEIIILDSKGPHTASSSKTGKSSLFKLPFTSKSDASMTVADPELDLYAVSRYFRLDLKRLNRRKQYQILYFPLTAPLTDSEKKRRKVVTSTKFNYS